MWISGRQRQEAASGKGTEPVKNLVCSGSFEDRQCGLSQMYEREGPVDGVRRAQDQFRYSLEHRS